MLSRRAFVSSALPTARAAAAGRRPNIILLLTDQQSRRATGLGGALPMRTPAFDSIAREGVSFANSWCAAPVCGPSRSSLVTGRYPHETGVVWNGQSIRAGLPSMGEIFRAAGYDTAWSGKWHLPQPWAREIPGFEALQIELSPRSRFAFGDFTDSPYTTAAIEFLKRKRDRPFLLAVSLHNPHDICHWIMRSLPADHPSMAGKPPAELPPLPRNFAIDPAEPEYLHRCRKRKKYGPEISFTLDWDETAWRQYLWAYARMTERVDHEAGRLLQAVNETGHDGDTLIVFTSDHGEGMAAHHWVVKLGLFEEPLSVPLAFRWKGVVKPQPVNRSALVSGVDLLPTLCGFAGIAAPPCSGVSLQRAIERGEPMPRKALAAEVATETGDDSMQGRVIRDGRYKYIAWSWGQRPEQLFDLRADPAEMRDLARSPEHARTIASLRGMLSAHLERTADSFKLPERTTP